MFYYRFADFETTKIPSLDADASDCSLMKPYSYALSFVDKNYELIHEERDFTKKMDGGERFIKALLDLEEDLFAYSQRKLPMHLTLQDKEKIKTAKQCHICEKDFVSTDERVRDHCHFNGYVSNILEHYFDANIHLFTETLLEWPILNVTSIVGDHK